MRFQTQAAWEGKQFARVPWAWRGRVSKLHRDKLKADTRAGNLWLLDLAASFEKIRVPVTLTDAELIEFANKRAAEALSLGEVAPGVFLSEPAALRRRLDAYCGTYGINPPEPLRITRNGTQAGVTDAGAISRMCCPIWWRRRLRQAQARALEGKAIELGYVHKRGEIYASDATVERRQHQKARNAAGLEATEAINRDTGEIYTLAALAAASVANPRIRRGELMTRIAGFEAIAQGVEHAAEFVTITLPSKYHAKRTGPGGAPEDNPKYNGATPRDGQGVLARMWANIRAKLHRLGVMPYGFRIAEPHHDGTPHWHMLLFVAAGAVKALREVIRAYALREDGNEAGADKNRVEFVAIDWSRGSAAGYVAKYVSKNIDGGGYQVQGDTEGGPGDIFPGHRVEAWASTWGIRQFQQVGGPPVGVWRELRRLESSDELTPIVMAARAAADCGRSGHDESGAAGNWRRYVEVMGGPVMRRADRPIGVALTRPGEIWNYAAGAAEPANLTRYGETRPGAVYGVVDRWAGRSFASVRFRWEIRGSRKNVRKNADGDSGIDGRRGIGAEGGDGAGGYSVESGRESRKNRGGEGEARSAQGQESGFSSGAGLGFGISWSPVNNCSRDLPLLPIAELLNRTAEAERGKFWLMGADLARWIDERGNDYERGRRAGRPEPVGMGLAPGVSGGPGAGSSSGFHDSAGGQKPGAGTVGAGQAAGVRS